MREPILGYFFNPRQLTCLVNIAPSLRAARSVDGIERLAAFHNANAILVLILIMKMFLGQATGSGRL